MIVLALLGMVDYSQTTSAVPTSPNTINNTKDDIYNENDVLLIDRKVS